MTNEDFRVTEVSLVPQLKDKKDSKHTYIILQKSGFTTFEAQTKLKNYYNLEYSDISAEGLKDEDAITEQIISINKIITLSSMVRFNNQNAGDQYVRIARILGYGIDPVTPGVLHGNCFRVVLRGLGKKVANELYTFCSKNHSFNFINYYDSQRFGTPGNIHNTHIIGECIVNNRWKKAYTEIVKSNNEESKILKLNFVKNNQEAKEVILNTINPNKIRFFVKSYCSYLWNQGLSDHLSKKNEIFLYKFKHIGPLALSSDGVFTIQNIFSCPGFSYSISDQSIKEKEMKRTSSVYTTIKTEDVLDDKLNPGKKCLALNFFLPTGSYGTMLIRQIFLRMEEDGKRN